MPKTGTTAYQAALAPLASLIVSDPPELKHAPVFRYNRFFRPMFGKFIDENLEILAVMREPISWLGSWYRYRRRPSMKKQPNSTHEISFDAFIKAYMAVDKKGFANVGSQAKFLEPTRNGLSVTHLFRYEDQKGLLTFLEDRLETKLEPQRLNASPEIDLSLSPAVETELRAQCAAEFRLWEGIGDSGAYSPLSEPVRRR